MKKILFLVDSDRTIRLFYQEKLSLLGLEVIAYDDSEGLYEKIDRHRPDIIFMDMKRWEGLKIFPSFEYDIESLPLGYVIGKAADLKKFDVKVNGDGAKDVKSLELIICKSNKQRHSEYMAGEVNVDGLPDHLPHPVEIQNTAWSLALSH